MVSRLYTTLLWRLIVAAMVVVTVMTLTAYHNGQRRTASIHATKVLEGDYGRAYVPVHTVMHAGQNQVSNVKPVAAPAPPAAPSTPPATTPSPSCVQSPPTAEQKQGYEQHYRDVFAIFNRFWPNVSTLNEYKDDKHAPQKAFDDKLPVLSTEELDQFLQVAPDDMHKLIDSHAGVVANLPSSYPEGMYRGRGIVTVAGGPLMPVAVVTMRLLRRVSPEIPVELFMADDSEYEQDMCEEILPAMNVTCRILKNIYDDKMLERYDIHGYAYKALAMLASSFEDNLFLDADSIPVQNISQVFDQEPYKSKGYVLWPDYWFRTTSPKFFDIANVTLGPRIRGDLAVRDPRLIPLADRKGALPDKSTESGQILFSKRKHYKALLLATYYNLNGYNVYYPLLSQGATGEGDKETFIAALEVLNENYHRIKTDVHVSGFFDHGEFKGTSMLQAMPIDDFKLHTLKDGSVSKPRVLFVHSNFPKITPHSLFYANNEWTKYFQDGTRTRFYGDPRGQAWVYGPRDLELEIWQEHEWLVCNVALQQNLHFKVWINKGIDLFNMCEQTKGHVGWLKSNGY